MIRRYAIRTRKMEIHQSSTTGATINVATLEGKIGTKTKFENTWNWSCGRSIPHYLYLQGLRPKAVAREQDCTSLPVLLSFSTHETSVAPLTFQLFYYLIIFTGCVSVVLPACI